MVSNLHSVIAIVPATAGIRKGAVEPDYNGGAYRCEAFECPFEGPLPEAIGHTVQNQPNLVKEVN